MWYLQVIFPHILPSLLMWSKLHWLQREIQTVMLFIIWSRLLMRLWTSHCTLTENYCLESEYMASPIELELKSLLHIYYACYYIATYCYICINTEIFLQFCCAAKSRRWWFRKHKCISKELLLHWKCCWSLVLKSFNEHVWWRNGKKRTWS